MKRVIRNNVINLSYSLHDGAVVDFKITDDAVVMQFQCGFVKTVEPFEQVNGNIEFEKVRSGRVWGGSPTSNFL